MNDYVPKNGHKNDNNFLLSFFMIEKKWKDCTGTNWPAATNK